MTETTGGGCTCPKCGTELELAAFAQVPDETRMTFVLRPSAGTLIQARTVGATLSALAHHVKRAGKDAGVLSETFVEDMEVKDGALLFHLRILNVRR